MKIKRLNIYSVTLYLMLLGYMLGPTLSFKLGVARIDNPLTILFIAFGFLVLFLESKKVPRSIYMMLLSLAALNIWPGIHLLISDLTPTQFMDIMFFMVLPFFFHIFYQVLIRDEEPLGTIQKFLTVFALYVAAPPFIELATGIQFVSASEELTLEAGSLKGLFFNPNNLATCAVCMAPAILFFFQLEGKSVKERLYGWILFFTLGLAVFASVSRTAIGCYLLILFIYIVYQKNGLITIGITALMLLTLFLIPSNVIQEFLLSLNGNQFLERFSSRVYLFLYDLGSDNSVSYRQEIYNYFWQNPPLLLTGYGPKNFKEYFGGHLSDSLGFENPHSFIIELYLGFGIISLLGFIAYILIYLRSTVTRKIRSKSKVIAWVCLGIFLLAGFIPSTILRMPFIWLPCFLIFIYITCLAGKIQNTNYLSRTS
ncbi:O-antigen ligase family protein [Neisseria yangbaofengii]|uniref:O-antigen ligase family protein n=1 Tax=Neisseria yangbaofengii TaxID=2709396 RepID=UPI0013EC4B63|nr:O-antigen ligase family protein [Neisseria yangbaofengii]